jgi:hypothetical protein
LHRAKLALDKILIIEFLLGQPQAVARRPFRPASLLARAAPRARFGSRRHLGPAVRTELKWRVHTWQTICFSGRTRASSQNSFGAARPSE